MDFGSAFFVWPQSSIMRHWFFIIFILSCIPAFAATVDTITIHSRSLGEPTKVVVILPEGYQQPGKKFPVVYMLHGYTGNYSNWITRVPEIAELADRYQIILVCADGKNSWYIDRPGSMYESYVGQELPGYIDSSYRTLASREYRAITGLSMGGHGAMYLAKRHKDIFGAVGSMSGVLDLLPFKDGYSIQDLVGDTASAQVAKYSNLQLANPSDSVLSIIIDCGGDDKFISVNRAMHQRLLSLGVKHDYTERPGGHSWTYWRTAIQYQLLFFHLHFSQAPARDNN